MEKLRHHPKMIGQWPLTVFVNSGGATNTVSEAGILKDVQIIQNKRSQPQGIKLAIECDGRTFVSSISGDDIDFLTHLYPKLKKCIEKPIRNIGDMEIDF